MTPAQRNARHTVETFEQAVRDHAFLGSAHPGDQLEIERHYHKRKAVLLALLGVDYVITDEGDDE